MLQIMYNTTTKLLHTFTYRVYNFLEFYGYFS